MSNLLSIKKVCAGNYKVTAKGVAGCFRVFREFNGQDVVWFTTSSECPDWSDTAKTKRQALSALAGWLERDRASGLGL